MAAPNRSAQAFVEPFDPAAWSAGYVEGCAWHYAFPPYDLQGLARLHGGHDALARKVRQMLRAKSSMPQRSRYGYSMTHEMTEMRGLAMGQYGHNNQPGPSRTT